jgi:hypothetical protein
MVNAADPPDHQCIGRAFSMLLDLYHSFGYEQKD